MDHWHMSHESNLQATQHFSTIAAEEQEPIFHSRFCSLEKMNLNILYSLSNFVAMLCLRLVPDSTLVPPVLSLHGRFFVIFGIADHSIAQWIVFYIESDLINFLFLWLKWLDGVYQTILAILGNIFSFLFLALIRIGNCLLKTNNLQIMVHEAIWQVTNHYFL